MHGKRRGAEIEPLWSPAGRRIAWVSVLNSRQSDGPLKRIPAKLWTVRARGGKPRLVRKLPSLKVDEREVRTRELTWLPKP